MVFARHEVISNLSEGARVEDVAAGIHDAIASRVTKMVETLKVEPDIIFTGGVAKNIGVVKALEAKLGCNLLIPEEPLLSGAIGAALLSKEIAINNLQSKDVKTQRRLDEATFFEHREKI
jgi:(R)-2-hydroxyacyl-CoA dehydratese activating ATPase